MVANVFQLNQDKTEDLVIGPSAQREKLWPKLQDFKPSQSVKFLWFLNVILILTRFYFIYQKLKDFLPSCVFSQTPPIKVSSLRSARRCWCMLLSPVLWIPVKPCSLAFPKRAFIIYNSFKTQVSTNTRGQKHITPVLKLLHWFLWVLGLY